MNVLKTATIKSASQFCLFYCSIVFCSIFSYGQNARHELMASRNFTFSSSVQSFIVPEGVTSLQVEVAGASGGKAYSKAGSYGNPGLGGKVTATISVTPGQQLQIYTGGEGRKGFENGSGKGGFNGGANGGKMASEFSGGGGGGASDIRLATGSLKDRLIVAGGGGAAGRYGAGGNGGGLQGADGYGEGLTAIGGNQIKGGLSGSYYSAYFAQNGTFGKGGASSVGENGGGGGGGWYGGGGGAFGDGAGGSSYSYEGATNVIHSQGVNEGNGYVIIKWNKNAPIQNVSNTNTTQIFPLKVFPNPSSGEFTMQLQNLKPCLAEIRLQLSNGATFLRKTFPITSAKAQIKYIMPGQVPGVYFVTITTPEGRHTGKVIIQ